MVGGVVVGKLADCVVAAGDAGASQANPILSARRNVPWIPVLITYPSSLRDNLFYRSLGVAMFHRSGMFDQPNVFSPLALGRLPFVASPSNARH